MQPKRYPGINEGRICVLNTKTLKKKIPDMDPKLNWTHILEKLYSIMGVLKVFLKYFEQIFHQSFLFCFRKKDTKLFFYVEILLWHACDEFLITGCPQLQAPCLGGAHYHEVEPNDGPMA